MEVDTDNAYTELGLTPGATEIEVKTAWRKLVSQWHPDRNRHPHAVGRIQRINMAFEQIRVSGYRPAPKAPTGASPAPRRRQAQPLDPSVDGHAARPQSRHSTDAQAETKTEAETETAKTAKAADSGAARRQDTQAPARAIGRRIKVTLEEAALGCTRELRGTVADACARCGGAGFHRPGGSCVACAGAGSVRHRAWYGWAATRSPCQACHGAGVARQPCEPCGGSGKLPPRSYKLGVRIPAGVRDGDVLFVSGAGQRSGADVGDLNIRIEVKRHEFFRLDDDGTVHCEIPVHGYAWTAGRSIQVPTLSGLQALRLDRKILVYRLPGQGFPACRRGPRADGIVSIVPVFPSALSTDQQILLDQLIASTIASPAPDADSARLSSWASIQQAWERQRTAPRGKASA